MSARFDCISIIEQGKALLPPPLTASANDNAEQSPATANRMSLDLVFFVMSQPMPLLYQELLSLLHYMVRSTVE